MLNHFTGIGNLGGDPEVRAITSGDKVANFNVGLTEKWTDRTGQKQEKTEWVSLRLWRKQAEIAEMYLQKGSRIYFEGKLETRSWEAQNGEMKYKTEVIVSRFIMLDGKNKSNKQSGEDEFMRP